MEDALRTPEDLPLNPETRRRIEDPQMAVVVDQEVEKAHAGRRDPAAKANWYATHASPSEWANAAISAWAAGQCN